MSEQSHTECVKGIELCSIPVVEYGTCRLVLTSAWEAQVQLLLAADGSLLGIGLPKPLKAAAGR